MVITEPANAEVYVNGEWVAEGSSSCFAIEVGQSYEVEVRAPFYESKKLKVTALHKAGFQYVALRKQRLRLISEVGLSL